MSNFYCTFTSFLSAGIARIGMKKEISVQGSGVPFTAPQQINPTGEEKKRGVRPQPASLESPHGVAENWLLLINGKVL